MLQRDPTKRPTVSELMDCEGFIELKKHISKLNDVDEMNNLGEIHITYNDEDSGMATSSFSNSERYMYSICICTKYFLNT